MNDAVTLIHNFVDVPKYIAPLWTPHGIFISVITMTWIVYVWETYLSYRQHCLCTKTLSVPPELAGCMDQATYSKARAYQLDKSTFSFFTSFWEQMFQMAVLGFNGLPLLWALSGRITGRFGYGREHEITQTIVFSLLTSVVSSVIDLPFSIYSTFVIEERHGFNKQTPGFFVKDKIKKFIVMQAILLPIMACIVHIVKIGGDYFFVYLWFFCVVMSFAIVTVYADYIAPIFDKFTPLADGELRTKIEKLAASIDFPLKKLYVVEGSKRSSHSNAYFYGFHKNKRIVLFDTLLKDYTPVPKDVKKDDCDSNEKEVNKEEEVKKEEKDVSKGCEDDEIVAVLAHELGHWKLNHVLKNILISQVNLLLCFSVFSLLFKNKTLYEAFGFHYQKPVVLGLFIIFQYIFSPYNEILGFLMIMLSRRFEFQADAFAKILNKAADLRSALIKLNKDNLGFPAYDWLYSAWHHSHPPLLQRVRALGKID